MSPINRSMTRRPASLHRVPKGTGSPASAVLSGRSDFLPPVPRHFVSFARRYHPCACLCSSRPDAGLEAWGVFGCGTSHGRLWVETTGSPTFLGNPNVPLPCSSTPVGSKTPGQYGVSTRPPRRIRRRRPTIHTFRGSMTRLQHSLSTLRRTGHPATTQDSLPAAGQALPGGVGYPQGSIERFQSLRPT